MYQTKNYEYWFVKLIKIKMELLKPKNFFK